MVRGAVLDLFERIQGTPAMRPLCDDGTDKYISDISVF